jgi:aspartate/methionine/tyrosine aminotransferase
MPVREGEGEGRALRFAARLDLDLAPNALAEALAARRAGGAPVLDLTASNPTRAGFAYAEREILSALASPEALRYEPEPRGLPAAREAVTAYYAARGETVDAHDLLLTSSTSESYSLLFKLLAEPGDEVLAPQPSYPLLELLAALESVRLVRYPLEQDAQGVWRIGRTALERALSARTRAIVVVHPNNPTGSYVKPDERAWLEALCARCGVALVADEVFLDYASAEAGPGSFATLGGAPAFALSGLSKLAGLPQLKLGWIALAGPEPLRREAGERLAFLADTWLSVGAPVQHAAPRLLALRGDLQRQIRARVETNERLLRRLCTSRRGFRVPAREGGWYAVLEVSPALDEEALCLRLLREHGVLVHPGFFFDFERPGVLVLSLLSPPEEFAEGLARVIESAEPL